jgi:hypothetical protein
MTFWKRWLQAARRRRPRTSALGRRLAVEELESRVTPRIDWSYSWAPSAAFLPAGTGGVVFSPIPQQSAFDSADVVAADLGVVSSAPPFKPDQLLGNAGDYTLTLTLTDAASRASGMLSFHGQLSGSFSKVSANLTNAFLAPTTQTVILGGNTYTVTWGVFTPPGPPGSSFNQGELSAHIDVAPFAPNAGGPYAIAEGQPLVLDASQTSNPQNLALTYSWDVEALGAANWTTGVAVGVNPTLSPAQLQALGINAAGSPYQVRVEVTEPGGLTLISAPTPLTVQAAADVTLLSSAAPSVYGQVVVFTADVLAASSAAPTGSVQFQVDGVDFGSPVPVVAGSASSAPISSLAAGNHAVTGVYSGDENLPPGTGNLDGGQQVNPAPLTITADDQVKIVGDPVPALTASYSGFVNGDDVASLTTPPTLTTTATATSPGVDSPYPITASGAVDADYVITYVPGLLFVLENPSSFPGPVTIATPPVEAPPAATPAPAPAPAKSAPAPAPAPVVQQPTPTRANSNLAVPVLTPPTPTVSVAAPSSAAVAAPAAPESSNLAQARSTAPEATALVAGSAAAPTTPAAPPATPALSAPSPRSELAFLFDSTDLPPITHSLGRESSADDSTVAAVAFRASSPTRANLDGHSAHADPNLVLQSVDAPAKALQAISSVYEGDDSVFLFEALARGLPPSGSLHARSQPPTADRPPQPTAATPSLHLAPVLAAPLLGLASLRLERRRRDFRQCLNLEGEAPAEPQPPARREPRPPN